MVDNSVHLLSELRGPQTRAVEELWIAGWHDINELKGTLSRTDWRTHARIGAEGRVIMDTRNGPPGGLQPRRARRVIGPSEPPAWTSAIASHPDNLSLSWAEVNSSGRAPEPSPPPHQVARHCRYWMQGRCNAGWRCPYRHDPNRLPTTSSSSTSSSSIPVQHRREAREGDGTRGTNPRAGTGRGARASGEPLAVLAMNWLADPTKLPCELRKSRKKYWKPEHLGTATSPQCTD